MSLIVQLSALAARIASEIKGLIRPEHPGLARAWVTCGYNGSAMVLGASHNVSAVTRLAKGRYRITFATAFADTSYCWVATARSNTASSNIRFAAARPSTDAKQTGFIEIVCISGSASLADTTELNVVVYR